jgi:hypothetical protein
MTLRLIKGGKQLDLTPEVNLQFGKLMVQATYFQKNQEIREIQDLIIEHDQKAKEHLLLLELFKQYDYLLALGEVPAEFFQQFKRETEFMVEMENSPPKKNKSKKKKRA